MGEGKKALNLVEPYYDMDGFTPGKFKETWNMLVHWYEIVKKEDLE